MNTNYNKQTTAISCKKKKMGRHVAVGAVLLLFTAAAVSAAPDTVAVEITAPWADTPLLLEGLELLSQHAPAAYFDALGSVRGSVSLFFFSPSSTHLSRQLATLHAASGGAALSDREVHAALKAAAAAHLPPLTRHLYDLGLDLRVAAPAVVAALSVAAEQVAAIAVPCDAASATFAATAAGVACTPTALQLPPAAAAEADLALCDSLFFYPRRHNPHWLLQVRH
jgi:hypothetical protein